MVEASPSRGSRTIVGTEERRQLELGGGSQEVLVSMVEVGDGVKVLLVESVSEEGERVAQCIVRFDNRGSKVLTIWSFVPQRLLGVLGWGRNVRVVRDPVVYDRLVGLLSKVFEVNEEEELTPVLKEELRNFFLRLPMLADIKRELEQLSALLSKANN